MGPVGITLQALVGVCYLVFFYIVFKRPKSAVQVAERDRRMVLAGVVLQTASYPAAWMFKRPRVGFFGTNYVWPDVVTALVSLAAAVAAVILAWRARKILGRHWALAARMIEGHELVTDGPFAVVRHPIYVSMAMLLLAAFIGFTAPVWAAVAAAMFAAGTYLRVRPEEDLLAGEFGADYEAYRKRVPAFLPRIRLRRTAPALTPAVGAEPESDKMEGKENGPAGPNEEGRQDMHFQILAKKRYSCRAYKPDPVEVEKLNRVLEAARSAPTACNRQPFRIIVVKTGDRRKELGRIYGRDWFVQAPLIIGICAVPSEAWVRRADGWNSAELDSAIAMDHLIMAATEEGLGTCWIGAFDVEAARDVLGVPEDAVPVAFTPLGYPAEFPPPTKRRSLDELIRRERW